jgi:hypothetical protein
MPPARLATRALPCLASVGAALLLGLWLHDKGVIIAEEGMILAEAEELRSGQELYRDIPSVVMPGAWYAAVLTFELFGSDLDATRVVVAVLFALTAGVVYAIVRSFAGPGLACAAVAGLLVQRGLAFPLGTFFFYTEFAISFALATVLCLLRFEHRREPDAGAGWLAAAGVCLVLSGLFKQNVGAAIALGTLAWAAFRARRPRQLAALLGPALLVAAAVCLYFAAQGALVPMLRSVVLLPFTAFYEPARVPYLPGLSFVTGTEAKYLYLPALYNEEFLFPPRRFSRMLTPFVDAASIAVYALPFVLLAGVAFQALRRRLDATAALVTLAALAPFVSAFPRSDFGHVAQAIVGFAPLAAFAAHAWHRAWRVAGATLLAALAVLSGFLLWKLPYDQRFENPRAEVWLSPGAHRNLTAVLDGLGRLPPDAPVVILPTGGLYHFLSGRSVPQHFTEVIPHNVAHDGGAGLAAELDALGVRHVVWLSGRAAGHPPIQDYAPALLDWLETGFEYRPLDPRVPGIRLYERR